MNKQKKSELSKWLKSQSHLSKKWLYATLAMALLSGIFLLIQSASLAYILDSLIIQKKDKSELLYPFMILILCIFLRATSSYYKEKYAYLSGEAVRVHIRQLLLNKLQKMGPARIQGKAAGAWSSLLIEQVEDMQDFFARYLPQLTIAVFIPIIILLAIFPLNWAVGVIFLVTAPLIPIFMALVGMGAADANRRNMKALQRLSGYFYDRLRGLATIKLFNQAEKESQYLAQASDDFRKRTMEVLRLAFLSSAVLEFFTALSIALTAVYIGFSFLGELNFGHYGVEITLFTGLFILLLAPEFYQPLRELGGFYHAKSQALGAAESILAFLEAPVDEQAPINDIESISKLNSDQEISIEAEELCIYSPEGTLLLGPLSFSIKDKEKVAIIGKSGSGKTTLFNALLGFLPYQGKLKISGIELRQLCAADWRKNISWVGQNPELFHGSIRENICLSTASIEDETLGEIAKQAHVNEFVEKLEAGFDYMIKDRARGLSVGQAQRIALARALQQNGTCWFLDEPTASLDIKSEELIMKSLTQAVKNKTTLWITHRVDFLEQCSKILILENGKLIQQASFDELKKAKLINTFLSEKGASNA